MRPVQPCRNFLSTNARTNDLKKAPVPDEPWEVVGDVNNGESDDLRVRNQEARVCHPLCPAVQVIWLLIVGNVNIRKKLFSIFRSITCWVQSPERYFEVPQDLFEASFLAFLFTGNNNVLTWLASKVEPLPKCFETRRLSTTDHQFHDEARYWTDWDWDPSYFQVEPLITPIIGTGQPSRVISQLLSEMSSLVHQSKLRLPLTTKLSTFGEIWKGKNHTFVDWNSSSIVKSYYWILSDSSSEFALFFAI